MATLSIEHPDLLDFLTAKDLDREKAEGDISTFNISVLATDRFLEAVEKDELWPVTPIEVPGKYYPYPVEGPYTGKLPSLPEREDGAKAIPLYGGRSPPGGSGTRSPGTPGPRGSRGSSSWTG